MAFKMVETGEQSRSTRLVLPSFSHALLKSKNNMEWRTQQNLTLKSDLARLLEGTVKSTKPKPPSTKEIRKEAFGQYMNIIYRVPHNIKVDFDDFDEISFGSKFNVRTPYIPPVVEDIPLAPTIIPVVKAKKNKHEKKKAAPVYEPDKPKPVMPSTPVICETPVVVRTEIVLPKVQLLPPSPPPPPPPPPLPTQKPSVLPPLVPSPELPSFLRDFLNKEWFKQLYPHKKNIPHSLCPDSFFLQLVDFLCTCDVPFKPEILSVLETLHGLKLLKNVDELYQKLLDTVPKMVTPNMCTSEHAVLGQLLTLLIDLKSVNEELVKTLLTLSAYKELGLRERMLRMLKSIGVDEAEEWLWPELETWEPELLSKSNMWEGLYAFADSWLNLWTAKYKDHIRDLFLRSTDKRKPPSFTRVDVVNHFCSVQKEEYLNVKQAAPSANNAVLLPHDCVSSAIHRLGETYCMTRTRKPSYLILPPLRDRPFLLDFPNYISLPLPHIKLSPFHTDSEEDHLTFLDHRYYILEKSHVTHINQDTS